MPDYTEWVAQAQSADAGARNAAFDRLARDFRGMVYSVAYSRLSDPQLAEDASQEAFLAAYLRVAQLKDLAAFPAWLRRIAQTQSERQRRGQNPAAETADLGEELPSPAPSPETQLELKELRQRVRQAVAALPDRERAVTKDYYLRGESQREISERLNIPLATVKKRLQYARRHLRGLISGFNESFDGALTLEPRRQYQPVYIRRRRDR